MKYIKVRGKKPLTEKDLPVSDCIINELFIDSNNPKKERLKYCKENCVLRCLHGKEYKKIK